MEHLREEAKALKIKGAHLMKEETLIRRIEEAKAVNDAPSDPEVVETKSKQAKPEKKLIKEARSLQTPIGFKDRTYLNFVNDNKDDMPTEYALVKSLIEKYL